jgi:hypothetical protein
MSILFTAAKGFVNDGPQALSPFIRGCGEIMPDFDTF